MTTESSLNGLPQGGYIIPLYSPGSKTPSTGLNTQAVDEFYKTFQGLDTIDLPGMGMTEKIAGRLEPPADNSQEPRILRFERLEKR